MQLLVHPSLQRCAPSQCVRAQGCPFGAREEALHRTDWRVGELLRDIFGSTARTRRTSKENDAGEIIMFGLLVVLAVYLYTQFVVPIAVTMFLLSAVCTFVTVVVFGILYRREVFDGRGTFWLLLLTVMYSAAGTLVALWLVDPPLHGVIDDARAATKANGISGVVPYLLPLGMQLAGAFASFVTLLASLALAVANMSAALMGMRAWGDRWLWPGLFWAMRWTMSSGVGWVMALSALLALVLASGFATEWVHALTARE